MITAVFSWLKGLSFVAKGASFVSGLPKKTIVIGVLLIAYALIFLSIGSSYQKNIWEKKYAALELQMSREQVKAKEALALEWKRVADLQAKYAALNEEIYHDVQARLDALDSRVVHYGKRSVRVCPSVNFGSGGVPSGTVGGSPPIAGSDEALPGGLHGAVERDPRSGGNPEGYDLFPEVSPLMAEADANSIRCNALIEFNRRAAEPQTP